MSITSTFILYSAELFFFSLSRYWDWHVYNSGSLFSLSHEDRENISKQLRMTSPSSFKIASDLEQYLKAGVLGIGYISAEWSHLTYTLRSKRFGLRYWVTSASWMAKRCRKSRSYKEKRKAKEHQPKSSYPNRCCQARNCPVFGRYSQKARYTSVYPHPSPDLHGYLIPLLRSIANTI